MWLLIKVLLNIGPGLDRIIVLQTYATSQECQSERDRIGYEMAAAYPDDHDFEIACKARPKQST